MAPLQENRPTVKAALVASFVPVVEEFVSSTSENVGASVLFPSSSLVGASVLPMVPSIVGDSVVGDADDTSAVGAVVGGTLVDKEDGALLLLVVVGTNVGVSVVARRVEVLLGAVVIGGGALLAGTLVVLVLSKVSVVGLDVVVVAAVVVVGEPVASMAVGAGDVLLVLLVVGKATVMHSPGTPAQYTGTNTGHCRVARCSWTTASVGHSKASRGGISAGQAGGLRAGGT